MKILRNHSATSDPRLDCVTQFDERSRMFLSRNLPNVPEELVAKQWDEHKIWLDQGREGMCVGFGFAHELITDPFPIAGCNYEFAKALYKAAQRVDDLPGENYAGTSVLAGAKVCAELGYIEEYRWATSAEEVGQALSHIGPVVIGVSWHRDMRKTDFYGYIHPTGSVTGGHCVCLTGIELGTAQDNSPFTVIGKNSWGPAWGENGHFKISSKDLQVLVDERGAFCVPVIRNWAKKSGKVIPAPDKRPLWKKVLGIRP